MPASKYPQKLDTSVEIPPVRDNITEIGSDVINSLRSAIFNIEKTLGLNPQGAVGNTVAARIDAALDENGNIKSEALNLANVLSGPIIDSDVSEVAAIKESKLKLDFPTTLLQDEVSILNKEIESIRTLVEELAALLSVHIEPTAINRHRATAISVSEASVSASDTATLSLESDDLQGALETVYNAHINYTGANISTLNNSHEAKQIFYDNTETSDVIFSSNVQDALGDLASVESLGFRNALLNLHSNGRIRQGKVTDKFEDNDQGHELVALTSASYINAGGTSKTTFSLNTPVKPTIDISEFDILTVSQSTTEDDNKDYQIASVNTDSNGRVTEIEVYGGPAGPSATVSIRVTKNTYVVYNLNGFNCTVRPRSNKTNTPDVQVANPDCATIISSGIQPENITEDNHTFDISIDGEDKITINTFDSSVSKQTIDSIVTKINDQCVDQHLNISAYKVLVANCHELAIAHNVPNLTDDLKNRTIKISAGSNDDGTSELGFSDTLNIEVEGSSGHSLHINGLVLSQFGLPKEYDDSTIQIVSNTLTISLFSGTFAAEGIRIGDLVVISGSTNSSDDGSYRISAINGGVASLDLTGTTFGGELSEDSKIYIFRTAANIGEMTFEEVSSNDGSIIFDVFMTEEKDIFYSKRLEVDGSLRDTGFTAAISDVSRNFIIADETATIVIDTSGYATLTGPDLVDGEPTFVAQTGRYKIFSADKLSFIILDVNATSSPFSEQSVSLYGFNEISQNNYILCRGSFSTTLGRVLGETSAPGIPVLLDKRRSGTADRTIIGESFIEKYIEGPRNEIRSSGIVRGCQVSNVQIIESGLETYQTFNVSAGIAVVNGIRFEFPGVTGFRIDTDGDFYAAIDGNGCVVAAAPISNPDDEDELISPFFNQTVATLSLSTNDGYVVTITDLRLLIDNLDYKVLSEIIVSPDARLGHFTTINKAVSYASNFNKLFPDVEAPSIFLANGVHSLTEQVVIDFDLHIRGSGPDTVIEKTGSFAEGSQLTGDDVDQSTAYFMIGASQNTYSERFNRGVTVENLTFRTNTNELEYVGCMVAITQPISKEGTTIARRATYRFNQVNFIGTQQVDGESPDPEKKGEYALVIGQQEPTNLVPIESVQFGNVFIHNCRFDAVGLEHGSVKLLESADCIYKNMIFSNNIVTANSLNLGDNDAQILEYPTTPDLQQIIESSNVVRRGL